MLTGNFDKIRDEMFSDPKTYGTDSVIKEALRHPDVRYVQVIAHSLILSPVLERALSTLSADGIDDAHFKALFESAHPKLLNVLIRNRTFLFRLKAVVAKFPLLAEPLQAFIDNPSRDTARVLLDLPLSDFAAFNESFILANLVNLAIAQVYPQDTSAPIPLVSVATGFGVKNPAYRLNSSGTVLPGLSDVHGKKFPDTDRGEREKRHELQRMGRVVIGGREGFSKAEYEGQIDDLPVDALLKTFLKRHMNQSDFCNAQTSGPFAFIVSLQQMMMHKAEGFVEIEAHGENSVIIRVHHSVSNFYHKEEPETLLLPPMMRRDVPYIDMTTEFEVVKEGGDVILRVRGAQLAAQDNKVFDHGRDFFKEEIFPVVPIVSILESETGKVFFDVYAAVQGGAAENMLAYRWAGYSGGLNLTLTREDCLSEDFPKKIDALLKEYKISLGRWVALQEDHEEIKSSFHSAVAHAVEQQFSVFKRKAPSIAFASAKKDEGLLLEAVKMTAWNNHKLFRFFSIEELHKNLKPPVFQALILDCLRDGSWLKLESKEELNAADRMSWLARAFPGFKNESTVIEDSNEFSIFQLLQVLYHFPNDVAIIKNIFEFVNSDPDGFSSMIKANQQFQKIVESHPGTPLALIVKAIDEMAILIHPAEKAHPVHVAALPEPVPGTEGEAVEEAEEDRAEIVSPPSAT